MNKKIFILALLNSFVFSMESSKNPQIASVLGLHWVLRVVVPKESLIMFNINRPLDLESILETLQKSNIKLWHKAHGREDELFFHLKGTRQDLVQKLKNEAWFDEKNLVDVSRTQCANN